MKPIKSALVAGIAVLFAASAAHETADAADPDVILLALADLKWVGNAARPGTYQAVAEGDPDTGPAHFYLNYAKGFAGGLHSHTSDHGGWILAGTVILVIDGKETKLPPPARFTSSKVASPISPAVTRAPSAS